MNIKKILSATALSLVVAAVPAMAFNSGNGKVKSNGKGHAYGHAKKAARNSEWTADQRAQFEEQFARFDVNRDGRIGRDEFPADANLFTQLDLNRDGYVTRGEVEQAVPNRQSAERLARGYDRNRDGVITRDEFPGNDNAFRRLDKNGDGVISAADNNGRRR